MQRRAVNVNLNVNRNRAQPAQNQNPVGPNPDNQPYNEAPADHNDTNDAANMELPNDQQQNSQNGPNFFRLMFAFVLNFFTSLIPERPRGLAN